MTRGDPVPSYSRAAAGADLRAKMSPSGTLQAERILHIDYPVFVIVDDVDRLTEETSMSGLPFGRSTRAFAKKRPSRRESAQRL
jgi:hypothetical protein